MEKKYYLQENGAVSQPYSLDGLRAKSIESRTLVCIKFGEWQHAKDIPELEDLIEWQPPAPIDQGEVQVYPQIRVLNTKAENLNNKKIFKIVSGAILVVAFFMPWITAFLSLNAWDIVFGSAGEFINSSLRYVLVVIPISGILIIYNASVKNSFTPKFKSLLTVLPLLTLIFVGIVIANKIDANWGDLSSIEFGEISNLFGMGLWLTLLCSLVLPFLGMYSSDKNEVREQKKALLKFAIILVEVFIPLYFLISLLPQIVAFASSLFGLLLVIVAIPLMIWTLIKLNKYLFSKL